MATLDTPSSEREKEDSARKRKMRQEDGKRVEGTRRYTSKGSESRGRRRGRASELVRGGGADGRGVTQPPKKKILPDIGKLDKGPDTDRPRDPNRVIPKGPYIDPRGIEDDLRRRKAWPGVPTMWDSPMEPPEWKPTIINDLDPDNPPGPEYVWDTTYVGSDGRSGRWVRQPQRPTPQPPYIGGPLPGAPPRIPGPIMDNPNQPKPFAPYSGGEIRPIPRPWGPPPVETPTPDAGGPVSIPGTMVDGGPQTGPPLKRPSYVPRPGQPGRLPGRMVNQTTATKPVFNGGIGYGPGEMPASPKPVRRASSFGPRDEKVMNPFGTTPNVW